MEIKKGDIPQQISNIFKENEVSLLDTIGHLTALLGCAIQSLPNDPEDIKSEVTDMACNTIKECLKKYNEDANVGL